MGVRSSCVVFRPTLVVNSLPLVCLLFLFSQILNLSKLLGDKAPGASTVR